MYLNTFINLEENITGYGRNSKKPSGHTIITMPGMVRLYLQDLKELTDKKYICYALSKKDNKAVRLGEINSPSENKMTNWRIDINNVLGKGIRADNIDCIAVVIEGNTVGNTDTVMLGYVGEKYLITPLLEKGLPKKEVKLGSEERKDKTPTTDKSKQGTKMKTEEKPQSKPMPKPALPGEGPGPVIIPTPIPSKPEPALPGEGPGPVVIPTPIPSKPEPALPGEGPGPVIIPTPIPCKPEPALPGEGPGPVVIPTPIPSKPEPALPGEGPGPVIIPTPIPCKAESKPAMPDEGIGPVIMPAPKPNEGNMVLNKVKDKEQTTKESLKQIISQLNEEKEEEQVIKKEEVKKDVEKKKTCGCQKEHKKDIIEEIIKILERDGSNTRDISKAIEGELKELIATGISKNEILNKKNELEVQIKNLLNDKLSIRNDKVEEDIETQIKNELNKQFNLGYRSNRNDNETQTLGDRHNNEVEGQETTREEVDFLEQLEDKFKNLQGVLKNNTQEVKKNLDETSWNKPAEDHEMVEEYSRIREIFESSVEIEPFDEERQPVDWVRISLAELISIPQIDYEWATQPFITFSYHKFNHLILGKDREINQYYIGIPDVYHQTRNHILEIDKIERFICRNTDKLTTGEPGYWIAMV